MTKKEGNKKSGKSKKMERLNLKVKQNFKNNL